jgi:hypothetical protein
VAALYALIAASAMALPSPSVDAYGGQALVLGRSQHPGGGVAAAPGNSTSSFPAAKTQAAKAPGEAGQRPGGAQSAPVVSSGAAAPNAVNTHAHRASPSPPTATASTAAVQDSSLLSTLDIVLLAAGLICLAAVALGVRRLSRRSGG